MTTLFLLIGCGEMRIEVGGDATVRPDAGDPSGDRDGGEDDTADPGGDTGAGDTAATGDTGEDATAICAGADYCLVVQGVATWYPDFATTPFDATFAITGEPHTTEELRLLDVTEPGNVTVDVAFRGSDAARLTARYGALADHAQHFGIGCGEGVCSGDLYTHTTGWDSVGEILQLYAFGWEDEGGTDLVTSVGFFQNPTAGDASTLNGVGYIMDGYTDATVAE